MKNFLVLLTVMTFYGTAYAQDVIVKKNGEEVLGIVHDITATEVHYKILEDPSGAVYIYQKDDLLMIHFEDGSTEIFAEAQANDDIIELSGEELYLQGQKDAGIYCKGYKGAGTGTLITALISPLAGLIPAIATSSTTPKKINLHYPDADLTSYPEYYDGYSQRAKKIKQGKVWKNWGIALGVNLVVAIAIQAN